MVRCIVKENGVITHFHFIGDNEPLPVRVAYRLKNDGQHLLLESRRKFTHARLAALAEDGPYWLGGIVGETGVKNKVSVWAGTSVHRKVSDGTLVSITHDFGLPKESAYQTAQYHILYGPTAVPIYLKALLPGKTKALLATYLKSVEIRDAYQNLIERVNSFRVDVPDLSIRQAFEFVTDPDSQHVSITHLLLVDAGGEKTSKLVKVGGKEIFIKSVMWKQMVSDLHKAHFEEMDLRAEVDYEPLMELEVPSPSLLRVGYYEDDNPAHFERHRFRTLQEFVLRHSAEKANGYDAMEYNAGLLVTAFRNLPHADAVLLLKSLVMHSVDICPLILERGVSTLSHDHEEIRVAAAQILREVFQEKPRWQLIGVDGNPVRAAPFIVISIISALVRRGTASTERNISLFNEMFGRPPKEQDLIKNPTVASLLEEIVTSTDAWPAPQRLELARIIYQYISRFFIEDIDSLYLQVKEWGRSTIERLIRNSLPRMNFHIGPLAWDKIELFLFERLSRDAQAESEKLAQRESIAA